MSRRSIVPFGWGGSMLPGRTANDDPFVRLWHEVDRTWVPALELRRVGAGPFASPAAIGRRVLRAARRAVVAR